MSSQIEPILAAAAMLCVATAALVSIAAAVRSRIGRCPPGVLVDSCGEAGVASHGPSGPGHVHEVDYAGALRACVDAVLVQGLRWPGFPQMLEARYRADEQVGRLRRLRIGALIGVVVYDLFLLTDAMVVPDVLWLAGIIRLGIVTPILVMLVAAMSWNRVARHAEWVMTIGAVIVPASISLILLASRSAQAGYYHSSGFALAFTFYVVVMRMRLPQSSVACAAAICTGFGMVLVSDMSTPLATSYGMTFLCTQLFMLMGAYRLDVEHRRSYLISLSERLARQELDRANARLAQLSELDPLTGMPNRRQLDVRAAQVWEQSRADGTCVGVAFIDVDHFKAFNDRYGHAEGDRCLKAVGAALTRVVGGIPGALVARYGGEEFVAILPTTTPEFVKPVADRMRSAIVELAIPHEASPHGAVVTVSIGVAVGRPGAGDQFEQTLDAADRASYAVKRAGRNRVTQALAVSEADSQAV